MAEVNAVLAEHLARQLDKASADGRAGDVVRLTGEIRKVLADVIGSGEGDGGGGSEPDRPDPAPTVEDEFAAIVGADASVGNAS